MIRFNIMSLLEAKGKTRYWLAKQTGMSHQNVTKIIKNENRAIYLETIEIFCQVLECTPNDLFEINFDVPEGK